MKIRGYVLFIILLIVKSVFAQYKLRNIPFDLASINKQNLMGKQGVWIFYDKTDSTVFAMENFRNDTLNGYFERYWYNGQISEKGFYKEGKLDSIFIAYWEDGEQRGEAFYLKGLLNGIVTSYSKNKEISTRLKYLNGLIDSSYKESFVDKRLVMDNYVRNKIDTLKTIYKSGWNKKYAIYQNDTLIKEISFYKDVIAIENFYERKVLFKRIVYSKVKPFKIDKIFIYENGELVKTEFYDKHGKLEIEK